MPRSRATALASLILAAVAAALAPAAAGAQPRGQASGSAAPKPFLDVRDAQRRAVERRGAVSLRAPSAGTRAARARLRSAGAVVAVDPLAGTPRLLAGRAGPLSAPASGDRRDTAERYLRGHLAALGLSRTDLGSLHLERRSSIPGGATLLGYRQYVDGIPSFDGGLRVMVDAAGRVASVSGPAQPRLALNSTVPALTATDAMRRLMADVGVRGATRPSGTPASLVAFGEGTSARLGWQLDLRAGPAAHYAAVVDAADGRILYRANSVKSAANDALVWEQYPGAARGGTPHVVDLTPYLNPSASDLSGPYARAWPDTNDNDVKPPNGHIVPRGPDPNELVVRNSTTGSFVYPFTDFTTTNANGACDSAHKCSWNFDIPTSWQTNSQQNAVQAFYFVNRYRDHLLAAPISFKPSDGNFDNGDRVLVNTDDGADTTAQHGPDSNHVDNAYMDTPPDGTSPTMAMFLWFNDSANGTPVDYRDVNGGDDAAIVYHEYTHGLSGRLVTVNPSGGEEALDGPQSGAMGEGWSDWYAKDFLISQFPADDSPTAGDVDMGKYVDSVSHSSSSIRSQGLDCPVGAAAQCPGAGLAGSGGYTYGDFGKIATGPEVHADGEIWGETLWDLRTAVGSDVARAIVTQGMRISPPQPTFLDERDAILTADSQLFPDGDHSGTIWRVFAARGMGTDASSPSPTQDIAVEGFKRPPTAALAVSPSPAVQGQPVTFDASGSSAPDSSITSFDFDFNGDGSPEVTDATNPRQSFVYPSAGTFHPTVTVHDDAGQTDTAARRLDVGSAPPPAATPPPAVTPASRAPVISLVRRGTKGRIRFRVRCDSACAGRAKLTVSRKLAKRLHLGTRRTVGTLRVKLAAAGSKRFTIKLSKRTLRALRRAGLRRIATRLSVTVTDAEHQRTAKGRATSIRR